MADVSAAVALAVPAHGPDHICEWGPVQVLETPRYMLVAHPELGSSARRYRGCECGEQVWDDQVVSPEVLAHLTPAAQSQQLVDATLRALNNGKGA